MTALRRSLSSAALLALAALVGCDNIGNESGRGAARPPVAPPKLSPVELLPPTVDRSVTQRVDVRDPLAIAATQIDVHRQSDAIVDILWVVDDSGSMKDERDTLVSNFSGFIQKLLSLQVNFHIGVISTNYADGGVLRGSTKVITNATPDPRSVFLANTTFPDSRTRWEQGLKMAQIALTPPLSTTGANAGFLRPNAALAIIAVSDEDDGSFGDPAYYARVFRSFKGKGNENLVTFSTISGTTPNGCYPPGEEIYYGGLAEPGFRYSDVALRTAGIVGSICDPSFDATLVKIAEALNTLRRAFPLSLKPDASTITVRVNGVLIAQDVVSGWQYQSTTQSITFLGNYVPPPGATVQIQYAISPS